MGIQTCTENKNYIVHDNDKAKNNKNNYNINKSPFFSEPFFTL